MAGSNEWQHRQVCDEIRYGFIEVCRVYFRVSVKLYKHQATYIDLHSTLAICYIHNM